MNETLCQCQTTRDEQSTTSITVEIPTGLLEQLREAAVLAKTDCQSLLLCYARQGLLDSGMKLKRGRFVEHVREVLDQHGVQKNAIEEIFNKFLY